MRANLKAVAREIKAVKAALEGIDEAAEQEAREATEIGSDEAADGPTEGSQEEKPAARDDGLQRAGLAQRLEDLLAKKDQWKASTSPSAVQRMP